MNKLEKIAAMLGGSVLATSLCCEPAQIQQVESEGLVQGNRFEYGTAVKHHEMDDFLYRDEKRAIVDLGCGVKLVMGDHNNDGNMDRFKVEKDRKEIRSCYKEIRESASQYVN